MIAYLFTLDNWYYIGSVVGEILKMFFLGADNLPQAMWHARKEVNLSLLRREVAGLNYALAT